VKEKESYYFQDTFILFVIYAAVISRNHLVPEIVYPVYQGVLLNGAFPVFMLFVRCAMTRIGQGADPKPFLRNFFFNLLRQLGPQMLTLIIMDGTGYKRMVDVQKQVLFVFILTLIFQFVSK